MADIKKTESEYRMEALENLLAIAKMQTTLATRIAAAEAILKYTEHPAPSKNESNSETTPQDS